MDRERNSSRDLMRQVAQEYWVGRHAGQPALETGAQWIPVNVYETDEDIVITAPMPGIEPEDVDIEVAGSTITLRAELRGPGQTERRYLVHEWTYGPYERVVNLPVEVDAQHANASHGNGVLVVSLPKASRAKAVRVALRRTGTVAANQQGHSGHHTTREGLGEAPGPVRDD